MCNNCGSDIRGKSINVIQGESQDVKIVPFFIEFPNTKCTNNKNSNMSPNPYIAPDIEECKQKFNPHYIITVTKLNNG